MYAAHPDIEQFPSQPEENWACPLSMDKETGPAKGSLSELTVAMAQSCICFPGPRGSLISEPSFPVSEPQHNDEFPCHLSPIVKALALCVP